MKLKRRPEHALSDSGSAQQLFAIVVLTCEKERYMIKRTATVLTMIAALATTAVAWAGPVSASSSQDDDDLPRFGPGNQYRPVIEAKDTRKEYRETRLQALGHVDNDYFIVVYTWRGTRRRIISAWKVDDNGKRRYQKLLS